MLLIVLVGVAAFGLGRASIEEGSIAMGHSPQIKETTAQPAATTTETDVAVAEGQYVASKNGTKYHLPWCSGAQRMKEENKIWFSSKEDAEAAGYTPAANCKGI